MAKISTSLTTDPKNIEIAKEVLEGKKQMMKVRGEEIKGGDGYFGSCKFNKEIYIKRNKYLIEGNWRILQRGRRKNSGYC